VQLKTPLESSSIDSSVHVPINIQFKQETFSHQQRMILKVILVTLAQVSEMMALMLMSKF